MTASFVIVNYNRKNELLKTLSLTKELIKDNPTFEIVVVDNASTDGSADAVKEAFPGVVLIRKPVNIGAPAWNEGFEKAKGDYFIILDDDSHIETGLEDALNYMEQNRDVGVLALNITSGPYTSKGWKWEEDQDLVGFIGCGAIFRKETYQKTGGYADWMFLYVNEWDLGLRVLEAGYRVKYFAKCTVVHRTSAINRTTKRLRVFVTKHELALVYKYFPKNRWKYLLRVAANNLKGLINLEFRGTWFKILGMLEFLKMRKSLVHTPISNNTQQLFLSLFWATTPPFKIFKTVYNKVVKKTGLQ